MQNKRIGCDDTSIMLKSACKRDSYEIREQNRLLTAEVGRFISPEKDNFYKFHHSKNKLITKRAAFLPIITFSLLGGVASKQSPLDALGSMGSSLFGMATAKDVNIIRDKLKEHAQTNRALAINQEEIASSIKDIQNFILNISLVTQINTHNMAQIYAELDNKGIIRHLQNIIQLTF